MGRDDLVISARSIFLNKGNRRKFSLLTLIVVSIIVLSLEYFKTGPINQFRLVAKDAVFKTSYIISLPFLSLKNAYYGVSNLLKIHEENKQLKIIDLNIEELKLENQFLKEENTILKVREEFYEIIVWDYFPETKAHRYRETFYIDRVTGTLRAQTDALIKQTNQILPYMSATYYNCKKIRKHQLPKKNIKKKF